MTEYTTAMRNKKSYEQLTIADDFMFCKIMTTHPKLCRHLLELILQVPIREIHFPQAQKTIDLTADAKSIRLDVYVNDEKGTIYNIEMQTSSNVNLPKRSRYYQDMIDLNILEKGKDYMELPGSIVIFICTFDQFHRGIPVYTFSNRCHELPDLELNDATKKIFLNPCGSREGLSADLNAFFDYLLGHLSDNQFVRSIEESVENARQHKEWRREYMTLLMRDQENFRAGKAEGLAEGKAEGLAEGKAKGLAEGKVEGTVKGIILLGTEFGLSQEEILKKIVEQTGMDSERALEF